MRCRVGSGGLSFAVSGGGCFSLLLAWLTLSGCGDSQASSPSGGSGGAAIGGSGPIATSGGTTGDGGSNGTGGNPESGGESNSGGSSSGGFDGSGGLGSGGLGSGGDSATGGSSGEESRSDGCGEPRSLEDGRHTLQSGSAERSYLLRVPPDYDPERAYRLVFAYHWSGGTANDVAAGQTIGGPFYGLWDQSEGSTIFVAPEGFNQGWGNAGGQDVAFTDDILAEVESKLCIDKSRIFATGFSFGGAMSYAIACARAKVFRAAAVYSAALLSGCEGGTDPFPYFAIRGVQEPVINPTTTGRALRDHFAEVNGCTAQTPPEPATGSGTHLCTSYEGCQEGFPVRWCAFDDGHVASPRDQGQTSSWVPAEAWQFLEQF